jgi:hypothetical protein
MNTPPENRMVVVNIAMWHQDFTEHRMYCCPATEDGFEKGYVHYPAKYLANYTSKGAHYVSMVAACVRLRKNGPDEVLWKFDDISDEDAIIEAERVRKITRRNERPCLVFLQSQPKATNFVYDPSGGLMSSRAYFDLTTVAPDGIKDLADKLRDIPWSALPKLEIS